MLAVVIESGEPTRLYTAFSLLVSTAVEGEAAHGLVSFGALPVLLDDSAAADPSFAELRASAAGLPDLHLNVCAAALEATGAERADAEARVGPVMSTPRFLKQTAGARLVVV
jgi:peroxiredoxin family protein